MGTSLQVTYDYVIPTCSSMLLHPLVYARTMMMLGYEPEPPRLRAVLYTFIDGSYRRHVFPNIFTYLKRLREEVGLVGLFTTGLPASVLGAYLKSYTTERTMETSKLTAARVLGVAVSYPFQVIMIRQMAEFAGCEVSYGGLFPRLLGEVVTVWMISCFVYVLNEFVFKSEHVDPSLKQYTPMVAAMMVSNTTHPLTVTSTVMAVSGSNHTMMSPENLNESLLDPIELKPHRRQKLHRMLNLCLCTLLILCSIFLLLTVLRGQLMRSNLCTNRKCIWPFNRYTPRRSVLLISMDGFRHDYIEIVRAQLGPEALPNFARLQARGVRPRRSINAFPTITMPNHQTLITGLYPQTNGIVANSLLDSKHPNDSFVMGIQYSLNQAPWLTGWPEPIWVTVQRAGKLAGSLLWPLTDGPVRGDLPFQQVSQFTQLNSFSSRYSYKKRVDDLLWWLDNPRYHLDLVLAYFDEPDESGHAYGPYSEQVAQAVAGLDVSLGELLDGMDARGLSDRVDVILTADHGMTNTSVNQLIALDTFVSAQDYRATLLSTSGLLFPLPGKEDDIYQRLKGAHPHLTVHRLADVPLELNFNQNTSRMPSIVLLPDPGWYLVHHNETNIVRGDHGYVPTFSDMNPFLIASGPSFRRNVTLDLDIHAVDVYPLMCRMLRVQPQPNNGSLERILPLVRPDVATELLALENFPIWFTWLTMEIEFVGFLACFAVILTISVILIISLRLQRKYSQISQPASRPSLSVDA